MTTPAGTLIDGMDDDDLDRLAARLRGRLDRSDDDRLLNTEEAATYLRAKPDRIWDLVRTGHLTPERDGRRLLFRRRELDRHLQDR